MKCFIIGGNGFVGRYLANELQAKGIEVVVCDMHENINSLIDPSIEYRKIDIRKPDDLNLLEISSDDIVVNLAANQYHTKVPRNRNKYFSEVNTEGTRNLLQVIYEKGCRNFIMFTTDMTYGKPQYLPVNTSHPQKPFGPYGLSKVMAEQICFEYRDRGMNITIFRPRMINGPGRLGILTKLFKLIDLNLPVPTIGNGRNHYQMVSVFDCVSAIMRAMEKGIPNAEYNLGSKESPDTRTLLQNLIYHSGSKSFVMPTPGKLVKSILNLMDKIGLTLMYPEQFMIADEEYILDISKTEEELGWTPRYNDEDMLNDAYRNYKKESGSV